MTGHEDRDVQVGTLVKLGIVMALLSVGTFLLMGLMFKALESREKDDDTPRPPMAFRGHRPPPPPRLEVAPARTRVEQRAREKEILGTYSWVDREQGIVRIPIERAMDLVVSRLPARSNAPGAP